MSFVFESFWNHRFKYQFCSIRCSCSHCLSDGHTTQLNPSVGLYTGWLKCPLMWLELSLAAVSNGICFWSWCETGFFFFIISLSRDNSCPNVYKLAFPSFTVFSAIFTYVKILCHMCFFDVFKPKIASSVCWIMENFGSLELWLFQNALAATLHQWKFWRIWCCWINMWNFLKFLKRCAWQAERTFRRFELKIILIKGLFTRQHYRTE